MSVKIKLGNILKLVDATVKLNNYQIPVDFEIPTKFLKEAVSHW